MEGIERVEDESNGREAQKRTTEGIKNRRLRNTHDYCRDVLYSVK